MNSLETPQSNNLRSPDAQRPSASRPCLGPVADLERHLPRDWWRTLFNSLYLKTDADVVENERNTSQETERVLSLLDLEPSSRILDVCCGQGRHCFSLASKGYKNVCGVDRSRYLIRLARKRASRLGYSSIRFSEGDARRLRYKEQTFDAAIIMGNSFGYFEKQQEDLEVLRAIHRVLRSNGKLLLDVTDGDWMSKHFAPRSWEWIDQKSLVCRERHLASDGKRLISRELVIEGEKGVIADQFYAERLYTVQELTELLEKSGFTNIQHAGNLTGESSRASGDLGMMENRIVMVAQAPFKEKPISKPASKVLECTVLMGDPTLPDQVKRDGHFNAEDHETVDKLKEALSSLDEYDFNYLNNHKRMVENLLNHPPAFVFNLCDEGFANEATKEAHITALLEMLNIPYTGAGPGCLSTCYDKSMVSAIATMLGIPTPEEIWIDADNLSTALPAEFPAFVKPVCGDSSIGISQKAIVNDADELIAYFDWLKEKLPGKACLVQEFLSGREFSVTLIGNGASLRALPILEVDYSKLPPELPKLLGYESKWLPDSPYWTMIGYQQADISEELERTLIEHSIQLFDRLECRDYARFDFREDSKGVAKLMEINPNPGWCWDGKVNLMASFSDWSYADLLREILQAAKERLGIA